MTAFFVLSIAIFALAKPVHVSAATLHFSPAAGVYSIQNSFTISVMASTNQAMNGAEAEIQFPTKKIEVIGVSKRDSIFSLWVQEPTFSNLGPVGRVNFSGVRMNPGFTGNSGKILDITFRVKETGSTELLFGSGAILANDGRGTNIISSFGSGVYTLKEALPGTVIAPAQTKPTVVYRPNDPLPRPVLRHFVQDRYGNDVLFATSDDISKWSNSLYAKFTWVTPPNATGVVYKIDDKPDTDPGSVSQGMIEVALFPRLQEGKQYLHIRYLNAAGPGPVLHYPLFIDVNPPKDFRIEFPNNEANDRGIHATSNPRPLVNFYTDDVLSGIDRYEVRVGDGEWIRAEDLAHDAPYPLPKQSPNKKAQVIVRAFDRAGNYSDATTNIVVEPVGKPFISYLPKHISVPRESLMLEGTAAPQADVSIVLRSQPGEPISLTTKADEDGVWRLVYAEGLFSGLYSVSVKQTISNGAESLYTAPQYVQVRSSANSWWWSLLDWLEQGNGYILLILLIVAQAVLFVYYRHRMKQFQRALEGDTPKGPTIRIKKTLSEKETEDTPSIPT